MMSHQFTKKETVLLLLLTALIMGLLYYQFVYKDIQNKKAMYDTAAIEDEILSEQTKRAQIDKMKKEIEENQNNENAGYVATYDNQKAEITSLNDILADADTFSLGFDKATAVDDAVRRNINVSFTAKDYRTAKAIISALHDSEYRCLIRDLTITANKTDNAALDLAAASGEDADTADKADTEKDNTDKTTDKKDTTKDKTTDKKDTTTDKTEDEADKKDSAGGEDEADQTEEDEALSELDLNSGTVTVSLTVEYFETLFESDTKDGLDIQKTEETAETETAAAQ